MAGEPSLYLVYKDFTTDERNSGSWHGTQDAADAAALAAGVGFSAHQGAVTIPNGWATGWIYNPTDDTWRTFDVSDLDELGQRKAAASALYAALDGQEHEIGQRMGIPSNVAGRGAGCSRVCTMGGFQHLYQRHLHRSATDRMGNRDAGRTIRCCGPGHADTESSALTDDEVPGGSAAWVSPSDESRSTLAGSKEASARWNAAIGDLTANSPGNRAWIEDIT